MASLLSLYVREHCVIANKVSICKLLHKYIYTFTFICTSCVVTMTMCYSIASYYIARREMVRKDQQLLII